MISLVFAWGLSGLIIGFSEGSHDVRVIGLILLGMAALMWVVNNLYTGLCRNRNASATLQMNEARRRNGGAL